MTECGVEHQLLVEYNDHAAATIEFNAKHGPSWVREWPFEKSDVRNINWNPFRGVEIVAGGPPCQPFSVGGKAAGSRDARDMWPEAVRAVREVKPQCFIFENVRGLLRPSFSSYVEWIKASLKRPYIAMEDGEPYDSHLAKLARSRAAPDYEVGIFPVNAADFGAPQKRHRVFIVGVARDRSDGPLGEPPSTHSLERLVWDKWISGDYWDRHEVSCRNRPSISPFEERIAGSLRSTMFPPNGEAWVTCRDAFEGLGRPTAKDDGRNHRLQPGARSYAGHTGSPLDEPSKALKAGVHGVPGGENMLLQDDGSVRYFTIREAARLQGLDDDFRFPGSWTESMRQIGNAVPTMLARSICQWVLGQTFSRQIRRAA